MTRWNDSEVVSATTLITAIDQDLDLPEERWAELFEAATPYQRRVARLRRDPSLAPHGVPSTYTNWGCRCTPCRESRHADRAGQDFTSPAPAAEELTRDEKREKMRAMGFDVIEDDMI